MKKSIGAKGLVMVLVILLAISFASFEEINAAENEFTAGLVLPTMNVYYLSVSNAVQETVEDAGGTILVQDADGYSASRELAVVEDLIRQDIDVLFIDASDLVASSAAIETANEAGVTVVGINQRTEEGEFLSVVASDNYKAGELAAEFVMEEINYEGKVAIIDGPPVPSVLIRIEAFEDVVARHEDVEIVAHQMMENTIADGVSVAEDILHANPDLDGFLGMNDFSFLGAITALQDADKVGEVALGAIDGLPEVVRILASGFAPRSATAAQFPYDIGEQAVQAYLDYRDGKTVQDDILVDVKLLTEENAEGFHW